MIPAQCDLGHVSSASANAYLVNTTTTQAGTVRSVFSQCDQCDGVVQTFVTEWEAHAVSALLLSRTAIAALRLNRAIQARRN